MWPCSALWLETPESMSATPTPRPVIEPDARERPAMTWSAPMAGSVTAIIERTIVSPER